MSKENEKMARKRSPSPLKAAIIKAASELFFENGFTKTTPGELCRKIDIGTGNLTYYFPTKEHMLAVLVQMMIDYQWKEMENATDEGTSSLLAYCLELTTLAAIGVVTIVLMATGALGIVPCSSRILHTKSSSRTPISFPLMRV